MSIYVHNNPNNIEYNAYVLMFIHSWYMPTQRGEPIAEDTWMRVPAVKTQGFSAHALPTYTALNANLSLVSSVDIAEDSGKVLKAFRARPGKEVPREDIDDIIRQAIDISDWEYSHKKPYPFNLMFNQELITYRFKTKHPNSERADFYNKVSSNITYNKIKKSITPKPCNCGRPKYVKV